MEQSYRVWIKTNAGHWTILTLSDGYDVDFPYALLKVRELRCPWRIQRRTVDFITLVESVIIAQSKYEGV